MINQTLEIENKIITNYSCTICMKEDLIDEDIYYTNCNHAFCKSCLDDWFQTGNQSCPLCRSEIDSYKHKNENYKLIIHEINNSENNQNNIELNINDPIVIRRLMRTNNIFNTLVKQNAKLRMLLFISFAGILFTLNSYLSMLGNFSELNKQYNECMENNLNLTHSLDLTSNLDLISNSDDCLDLNMHSGYYVNIYNGRILRRCFYPAKFYEACFH